LSVNIVREVLESVGGVGLVPAYGPLGVSADMVRICTAEDASAGAVVIPECAKGAVVDSEHDWVVGWEDRVIAFKDMKVGSASGDEHDGHCVVS
jgi:hypothetical protein